MIFTYCTDCKCQINAAFWPYFQTLCAGCFGKYAAKIEHVRKSQ